MGKLRTLKEAKVADAALDKPEAGKVYALTGGPGSRCIANGSSWKDSEVEELAAGADAGKEA
jgi:hypothetical protein